MDDRNVEVPGAREVTQVLAADPLYRVLPRVLSSPWTLGIILAVIVAAMVIFGPSSDSRFIYTDF